MNWYVLLLIIFLPFWGKTQVQIIGQWWPEDTIDTHILTTLRGDEFTGRLLQNDSNSVVFLLNVGDTLTYHPSELASVKILHEKPAPKSDCISERLLFAPTGFALEKGENEYRNILFLYNSYHHGITDRITIGGGFMPLIITYMGWVDAKFTFKLGENLHLGTGALLGGGFAIDFSEDEGSDGWNKYGLTGGFGAMTIGSRNKFINLSMARVVVFEIGDPESSPWLYSLGGACNLGKKKRLFFEAGTYAGNPDQWTIGLGISTLYLGNSFDAALQFFPGNRPRMLPAFAFARRF